MADYQLNEFGITRKRDGASITIPFDPEDNDYREYLEWLDAGGVPDPIPEPIEPEPDPEEQAIIQARHDAKIALRNALPEGVITQEQMDILFGPNGAPMP